MLKVQLSKDLQHGGTGWRAVTILTHLGFADWKRVEELGDSRPQWLGLWGESRTALLRSTDTDQPTSPFRRPPPYARGIERGNVLPVIAAGVNHSDRSGATDRGDSRPIEGDSARLNTRHSRTFHASRAPASLSRSPAFPTSDKPNLSHFETLAEAASRLLSAMIFYEHIGIGTPRHHMLFRY